MATNDDFLTEANENRREFSRVRACIPFSYQVIPDPSNHYMKSRTVNNTFISDFSAMPSVEDQRYGEWLKLINSKVDEIIRMLTLQREGFSTLPFKKITISGSGMGFQSPEPLPVGTIIEVRTVLTIQSAVALYIYGEILKTDPLETGYDIGFRFINMDDFVRNEIIRFVFEREREMIREKRGV